MPSRPPRRRDQTRPRTNTSHSRLHPSQRLFGAPMTLLDETLESWALSMTAQACSNRTIEDRVILLRAFARFSEIERWEQVTKRHIVLFLARTDIRPSTKQSYRSYLTCFFGWMVDEQLLEQSPAVRLPRVRVRAAEPDPVSTDEIQRLINSGIRAHTITKVLLYAYEGLRASEIASIDGQHLDWGRGRLWVANAKGGRPVWRPLHSLVWGHLLEEGYPRSGWFFPSHAGGHVTAGSVSDTIGKAMRRAGIEHRAHDLRKWHGTTLLEMGADSLDVQHSLRHVDGQSMKAYVLPSDRRIRAAKERLPIVRPPSDVAVA